MSGQKLSLKNLVQALTETASYASQMLRRDYLNALRTSENKSSLPPQPLCVTDMRVVFTANVTEDERSDFQKNGGDLQLEFNGTNGNFKGEIVFKPYDPGAAYGYETCSEEGIGEEEIAEPEIPQEDTPVMENYEQSEIY
ncbi:MAG: hypothetical protein LBI42_14230 [Chitinispirillales bacterium]|jgi:hypothetical protein|nr:hypothetical protein [Chitinispirillales bacterium]